MPVGVVKEIDKKYVTVHMDRQDMCADCHACDMVNPSKACTLRCIDTVGTKVGDTVEISLEQDTFLKATYIMYGFPFIGFIGGLGIGYLLSKTMGNTMGDLITIGCALLGMGLVLGIIKYLEKKEAYKKYLPHIIAKQEKK